MIPRSLPRVPLAPLALLLVLPGRAPAQDREDHRDLVLPHVLTGEPDRPPPGAERPVVHVFADGTIVLDGEILYEPEVHGAREHPWADLSKALQRAAGAMTKEQAEDGFEIVATPILIRADLNAPFLQSQKILELAAGASIRRFHFAVGDARGVDPKVGLLPSDEVTQHIEVVLPIDAGPADQRREQPHTAIRIRVLEPGRKLEPDRSADVPWKGAHGTRFRWDRPSRRVEYTIGPRSTHGFREFRQRLQGMRASVQGRPLRIDARRGVTTAETLVVLDAARSLGAGEVTFVASLGPRDEQDEQDK